MSSKIYTEEERDNICIQYYRGESADILSRQYKVSSVTIYKYIREYTRKIDEMTKKVRSKRGVI